MFVVGILVLLTVTAVVALAKRSPRGITVSVWIVGGAYAVFGLGVGALFLAHESEFGLAVLAAGLAAATGTLVHRSRPALGAGLLIAGGFAIAVGLGFAAAGLAAWGDGSLRVVIIAGLVTALISFGPVLLTGIALLRGRKLLEEVRL